MRNLERSYMKHADLRIQDISALLTALCIAEIGALDMIALPLRVDLVNRAPTCIHKQHSACMGLFERFLGVAGP